MNSMAGVSWVSIVGDAGGPPKLDVEYEKVEREAERGESSPDD